MASRHTSAAFVDRAWAIRSGFKQGGKRPLVWLIGLVAAGLLTTVGVTQFASAAPLGAIVNINGKCLDNKNNSSSDQNPVQIYTCNGGASQNWSLPGDGTIRINNKCLDTAKHVTKQGTSIVIATCGNYTTQKWTWAVSGAGKVTSKASSQCLDIPNNSSTNGTIVQSYGCWNTNAQLWTMPKDAAPTPPTVSVTSPTAAASVSGTTVNLGASASDATSVAGVQFQIDGINVGSSDTTAPYTVAWDSTAVADGPHSVTAVATNVSGLSTTSAAVTVNVSNTIVITPPSTSPSGEDAPLGDVAGWHQTFVDDFTVDAPLGSWATANGDAVVYTGDHGGQWTEYPDGWSSTYTSGKPGYQPGQVLSVHDGQMDFWLHDVNGLPSGANPSPLTTGTGRYQTYGRYTARIKSDTALDNYHAAWLLWPDLDSSGGCAESDFPEGNLNSTVSGFAHNSTNCSSYTTQDAFNTTTRFDSGWHTYTQEWIPGARKYYIDGQLIGTSTTRVWSSPMRWQLQTEPSGNTHASGHLMVDWVAAYSYQP
jgi:hypothetical protein